MKRGWANGEDEAGLEGEMCRCGRCECEEGSADQPHFPLPTPVPCSALPCLATLIPSRLQGLYIGDDVDEQGCSWRFPETQPSLSKLMKHGLVQQII